MESSEKEKPRIAEPLLDIPDCSYKIPTLPPDEYGKTVTVIVGKGPEERQFDVYKGLLTYYSSYFRGALNETWEEGATGRVALPEDSPDVFRTFFQWLMTGRLYHRLNADGSIPLTHAHIFKAYVFGDSRGIPEFCNTAITEFYQKVCQTWKTPTGSLNYVYENTMPGSLLRKMFVSIAIGTFGFDTLKSGFERDMHVYPKEFLGEVILNLLSPDKTFAFPKRKADGSALRREEFIQHTSGGICENFHDHPQEPAKKEFGKSETTIVVTAE